MKSEATALDNLAIKEEIRPPGAFNRDKTKNIVSAVAYLLGIKTDRLENLYLADCPGFIHKLNENKAARAIRILCSIRTIMLKEYRTVENNLNSLINIDNMPALFNNDDLKWLRTNGIEVIKANTTINNYIISINKLILDNIEKCESLFPGWASWSFIKDLFLMPGCYAPLSKNAKNDTLRKAIKKFWDNNNNYPYQSYINWPLAVMEDNGNILLNDEKFLILLYEAHGQSFNEYSRVRDAGKLIKINIHQFIEESSQTALVVDCENCDVYNLFSALRNLRPQTIEKLSKVILYDDENTTGAWTLISKFIRVPVEHYRINRVAKHKSLVDISLTAGVCKEYYMHRTESFILASSDSDFWGLVKALPDANFLVLMEYSKCGDALKEALSDDGIYYCSLDDFGKGNIEEFKEMAFKASLQEYIDQFNENGVWAAFDVDELVNSIFDVCRFTGTEKQLQSDKIRYMNKFIKALRFDVIENRSENSRRLQMTIGI
ncbi:MAG: hypothetical protein GX111_11310 [Clostridiales bacterium]|nr:hypothetical protein [Clostridiales bacterium]